MPSIFKNVPLAPRDPILGLTELYKADKNPSKINLSVGVYTDESGSIPVLQSVAKVRAQLNQEMSPMGYLPIDGMGAYNQLVTSLFFGKDSEVIKSNRVATVQGLGGTGALKVGADFLKNLAPDATVMVSDPTWANHHTIFKSIGFHVATYPYYDSQNQKVNFEALMTCLQNAKRHTIFLLHACCHNPTGYDLTSQQWDQVLEVMQKQELIPFLDIAYRGFADGFEEDGQVIQKLLKLEMNFLMAISFSKTFSLYGERVGALSIVCQDEDEMQRVLSQVKQVIRGNYSNPPTLGVKIVTTVLSSPELTQQWEQELSLMRTRIKTLRKDLVLKLQALGLQRDMSFISNQKGMFSYTGLSKEQMLKLRADFGVYGTDSGRICVACINAQNIDYIANALATVLK